MVKNVASSVKPELVLASGALSAYQGSSDVNKGSVISGIWKTTLGLAAMNLGSKLLPIGRSLRHGIFKLSILSGAAKATFDGFNCMVKSVKKRNPVEIIKNTAKTAMGVASSYYILTLSPRKLEALSHGALLTSTSVIVIRSGMRDVAKKDYTIGSGKMIAGAGGVAVAAYYVLSELFYASKITEITDFLDMHRNEINGLRQYSPHVVGGGWEFLGSGISKKAMEHPGLPGYIIKVPHKEGISHWGHDEGDLVAHYSNAQKIREFSASKFPRIFIPQSYLFEMDGPVLVEEKVTFESFPKIMGYDEQSELALDEFNKFIKKTGLCDLDIEIKHNAGFTRRPESGGYLQVGVIDFDCTVERLHELMRRELSRINRELEEADLTYILDRYKPSLEKLPICYPFEKPILALPAPGEQDSMTSSFTDMRVEAEESSMLVESMS